MAVSIPIGFRFHPTKEEVVISYLRPAIHGEPLPADVLLKIDIYGDKREPWNLFDKDSESSFWVFTKLKKRNASTIDRVAGCGSWVNQNFHEIRNSHDGKLLGFDKYFRFECKNGKSKRSRGNNNGNWTMHEFSLADKGLSEYVICEIKNKDAVDGKAKNNQNSANIDDVDGEMSAMKKVCVDRTILDASSTSQTNSNLNFGEFVHQELYQNQIMDHWSQSMVMNNCSPQGNYTAVDTQLIGQPNKVMISSSSPVEFTNYASVCSDFNGNELKSLASELEEMLSIPATTSDECNIGSSIYPTNSGFVDPYYQENQCPNFVQESQGSNFNGNEAMNLKSFSELEDLFSDVPVDADECSIGSSTYPTTHGVNSGFGEPYYEENQNPNSVDQTMIRNCKPLQASIFNDKEAMNLESFASELEDLLSDVPVGC
ncbi:No apical meristem (NAM) protein [Corchorus olitorius]|uniref:No apical meristem (NAM) protein n=2 Tax=Corchorus olitorius TaxID=93759 RepID=A0A1R3JE37_9ROSI|nr:No apical meristem (NAM) protein [Corchorus olitorius]